MEASNGVVKPAPSSASEQSTARAVPGIPVLVIVVAAFVGGVVLIVIGLAVGRIGTSARQADLPHAVVTPPVVTDANGQPVVIPAAPLPAPATTLPTTIQPAAPPPVVQQPVEMVVAERRP